jgi:peroxiredoxin
MAQLKEYTFNVFCLVFLLLNLFALSGQSWAGDHFMEELGIVQFDEKMQAPDFTLKDLNGATVNLKDQRGKIVFLNFWTTWCPPCRLELPSLEKLYAEFKDRDFAMLTIDLKESANRVKSFRDKEKLTFPILLDADGTTGLKYGVRSIPSTYLIDRNGYIIGGALGPRNWAGREAFELFNHLLDTSSAP